MGREKYVNRERHVYALTFEGRPQHVYIGQSIDPKRRLAQHRQSGDWDGLGGITLTPLGVYSGTRMDVERWELIWRVRAQQCGWRVLGGSNDDGPYVVDPMRRATRQDIIAAKRCKWPFGSARTARWTISVMVLALTLIGVVLHHCLVQ